MKNFPSGTVTFLFTDIEGSTRLLQEMGEGYVDALAEHRRVIRESLAEFGGVEVDTQGDAFFVAFADAAAAVATALRAQDRLASGPVLVRMGLHTGEPTVTDEGYVGLDVHRAARIAACGHGGQVLLSESTRRRVDADARDLGLHWLKDLSAPEHIFQLGEADFPPLRSLNRTNLPEEPTAFMGRERELDDLLGLIGRDDVRLVTLTGPGGSGKTRLALRAATRMVDKEPNGVWFVGLGSLTDPALLIPTIATTLGLRETAGDTFHRALTRYLQGKNLLMLLDNLEQLLPEGAVALGDLLAQARGVHLMVTSREPLRISAERQFPVRPLAGEEASRLFEERARAVSPDFALVGENRPTVDAICERVDRLPLAIELAAARIRVLPPAALLTRLEHRLPLLTEGPRDAPRRQSTLRATIAWSHDLLHADERALFARLGVFAGGCSLEGAEVVCGATLDGVASLIDKSLLRGEEDSGEPRYTMLQTIREYALEQLEESGEAEGLRRTHAEYFLGYAELARPELVGATQARWLDLLEADHDNLRGSLQWALDEGESELALRLAGALWLFWYMRGHVSEGRRWLALAVDAAPAAASEARATALDGAGYLAGDQGERETARALLEASLGCARQAGTPAAAAIAATHLSLHVSGEAAVSLGEEAVSLAREAGEDYTLAVALNNLGEVARSLGDRDRATALYEESYQIRRRLGDSSRIALSLVNLGEMALLAGDMDRAKAMLLEALGLAQRIGDKRQTCFALQGLGWVALAHDDVDECDRMLRDSVALARELGNRFWALDVLPGLAAVAAARGDLVRAGRLAAAAAALVAGVGHPPSIGEAGLYESYLDVARARCDRGAWEQASREGASMTFDEAVDYALS